MVIKNIEGRYIISDFEIKKVSLHSTGEEIPITHHGIFSGRYLYTLAKKIFDPLEIYGPRDDLYITVLSGVTLLSSKITYHTESIEHKMTMLGELLNEIDSPRKDVLSAAYSIPFRKKIKKYPHFLFGIGEDNDGNENHHCINFQEDLLRIMLYMQKWSNERFFINELKQLDFIDGITFQREVKVRNYKKIYLDDTEVTRDEFKNIFDDFLTFVEDELKEMNFNTFKTKYTEGMKWADLSS